MLQAIRQQIRNLRDNDSALKTRALSVGIWSVVELGAGNVLRLASNLIMTRLLVPEAFGLMAMVMMVQIALIHFTDLGIHQSVVRSERGEEPRFLRVAWTVQLLRSGAIALLVIASAALLFLLAPHLAPSGTVYADPVLPALIAVSSLSVILIGLESTNQWTAHRQMELKAPTLIAIFSQAAGIVAMVALAIYEPTVWSLLLGSMLGAALKTLLTHLALPGPRMRIEWDPEIARELWDYGKYVLGSSTLGFAAIYADRLILGALLDIRSFGFYAIAIIWVQAFVIVIEKLAGQIGLPAFSRLNREAPDRIRDAYVKTRYVIVTIAVLGFVACLLGGPLLIDLLYRPEYARSGEFITILSVMLLPSTFGLLYALLLSQGDSRTLMHVTACRAAAVLVFLWTGYQFFGVPGALIGSAIAPLVGPPLALRRFKSVLGGAVRFDSVWMLTVFVCAALILATVGRSVGLS